MRPENPEHTINSKTQEVVDHVKEYVNTQVEILKLQAIEKAAAGIGVVSLVAILVFLFVCIFILASVGLAVWISEMIGNGFSGFFIVAGVYLVIAVIIFLARDTIAKKVIAGKVITAMLPEDPKFNS